MKRKFLHLSESTELIVFSLLDQFVQVDANNIACVLLNDAEKSIKLIFLQSNSQRERKFPELIILDGTYKIISALYVVLVEDGCGNSCIVAYYFVAQETKVSLVSFLQIFNKYNPRWGDIKVTQTDKDMTEIVSIPHTVNLLCQFHMLKYICTKI